MGSKILHKIISPVNVDERRALDIRAGDTVKVYQKIQEKGKTRLQVFEGVVLATKHGKEAGGTFTVRRVSNGVGMEKIYPLYSPNIDKIEILKRAKVRQSKLYHIRDKATKEIRRQMRRSRFMDTSTESDMEYQARTEVEAKEEAEADAMMEEVNTSPEGEQVVEEVEAVEEVKSEESK
ncbi:50S ribosomal protein L19 [Candidatus Campbellbacteria bacterium CG22_combo_CG10-13_8_21_14_all_36_13]|uniref:50S ribosomal protein L19 n=1 Tax=Candidatus Campbellbacteria bacterium CG22_combo_CG10-13_8_21_14_all_36_13 TaxID=1974529 RepID=A0A2H0DXL4_9BACT|nr:MAG: 50S ribosomal protein L19 [Candidatus Campbellbacteria bacterium CG22_combo_CG10-13_8_21_14_all_36_13]